MKSISSCRRVMQAAIVAVCALLCLGSARGQVIALPLELQCPTNVVLWTCGGEIPWQAPLPVPIGGCSNYTGVCDPPVGTVFAVGAHQVTCRVTDQCGKVDSCTFTVIVRRDKYANARAACQSWAWTMSGTKDGTAPSPISAAIRANAAKRNALSGQSTPSGLR